jgi:serine/threonine protein kinase
VYAFGCVAFEILARRPLFTAPNEVAMVSAHVAHDGAPAGIPELARGASARGLAEILSRCLRRDPRARAAISDVRAGLRKVARELQGRPWPLPA